jgi:branched-chain amino acid transport system permease protein
LGPVVGAFISTGLEQYLSDSGSWITVIQGAIFVVCVLVFRRGVVGEIIQLARRFALPRPPGAAQPMTRAAPGE